MRNPRNKRRPRATPDGSHATGITPVSVLQRETAGFNNHDSLATINSVTRLYGVHLHYSSYLRSFYTLHDLLPPHAVKLLDSRTEIRENPGISPGGFIFIYARLVAYRARLWYAPSSLPRMEGEHTAMEITRYFILTKILISH